MYKYYLMNIKALQEIYSRHFLLESTYGQLYDPNITPEEKELVDEVERKIVVGKLKLRQKAPELDRQLGLLNINIVAPSDPDVQTMAVDNFGNIYINPAWSNKLSSDEFYGVLAHEALHILNSTHLRRNDRNPTLWNIATDAVMNIYLANDGFALPKEGIIPDSNTGEVTLKIGPSIEKTLRLFEPDKPGEVISAERLYEQLEEIKNELEQQAQDGDLQKKEGKPGEGKPGELVPKGTPGGKPISVKDIKNAVEEALKKLDNKTDNHLTDEKARRVNKDLIEKIDPDAQRKMEDELRKGLREIESTKTYGSPGAMSIRQLLKRNLPAEKVDWRGAIKSFLRPGGKGDYSWASIAHRGLPIGMPMPGEAEIEDKLDAIFAIDTSGSVGDKQLYVVCQYAKQIADQASEYNVRIILWSDQAYYVSAPLVESGALQGALAKLKSHIKQGGNNMSDVDRVIKQKKLNPYAVIYITDGQEPREPTFGKYKKLFVIVSSYLAQTKEGIEKMFRKHGKIVYTPQLD